MAGQRSKHLRTFAEFEDFVEEISGMSTHAEEPGSVSPMLFRGHEDSGWTLDTTLERYLKRIGHQKDDLSIVEYYRILLRVYPAFASHTGLRFDLPQPDSRKFQECYEMSVSQLGYDFLVYLRHIGFPSPLLDWTRSPYVASFFAFNNARLDSEVSVYCYQEYVGRSKGGWENLPMIVACLSG